jgi:hypothetical protein
MHIAASQGTLWAVFICSNLVEGVNILGQFCLRLQFALKTDAEAYLEILITSYLAKPHFHAPGTSRH